VRRSNSRGGMVKGAVRVQVEGSIECTRVTAAKCSGNHSGQEVGKFGSRVDEEGASDQKSSITEIKE
jgi:hypothetical protein